MGRQAYVRIQVTAAYGGSPLKDNIADMKRGAEVIVCTPGRMIELLITNSGRIINLRRITYLVLDEADRMFDMGFEPQVMKILSQIRPDRQTVLFSATFPRAMEALARKILKKPLEITVGGRSVVAAEIEQLVEVREEESKFNRLLEILGRTYNDDADTRTLIFVHRQDSADNLLRDLLAKNYACMSLHGGKEQVDRDAVISDFKAGIIPIVIATSVAARGLDVKLLKLVINYDCPNHMEDYVHRAGRTGRAGNKGTCITFITPEQDRYAVDLQKALEASKVEIPADLKKLADGESGRHRSASYVLITDNRVVQASLKKLKLEKLPQPHLDLAEKALNGSSKSEMLKTALNDQPTAKMIPTRRRTRTRKAATTPLLARREKRALKPHIPVSTCRISKSKSVVDLRLILAERAMASRLMKRILHLSKLLKRLLNKLVSMLRVSAKLNPLLRNLRRVSKLGNSSNSVVDEKAKVTSTLQEEEIQMLRNTMPSYLSADLANVLDGRSRIKKPSLVSSKRLARVSQTRVSTTRKAKNLPGQTILLIFTCSLRVISHQRSSTLFAKSSSFCSMQAFKPWRLMRIDPVNTVSDRALFV
jgi:superfamily II DNA/RNA helicase